MIVVKVLVNYQWTNALHKRRALLLQGIMKAERFALADRGGGHPQGCRFHRLDTQNFQNSCIRSGRPS